MTVYVYVYVYIVQAKMRSDDVTVLNHYMPRIETIFDPLYEPSDNDILFNVCNLFFLLIMIIVRLMKI